MKLLDDEQALRREIFNYFGYVEDWRILPFDDARECYWGLCEKDRSGNPHAVRFSPDEAALLNNDEEEIYENEIYTNRHLPKWVYRGEEYTMILVDTRTDMNQFLQIFSNEKERAIDDE